MRTGQEQPTAYRVLRDAHTHWLAQCPTSNALRAPLVCSEWCLYISSLLLLLTGFCAHLTGKQASEPGQLACEECPDGTYANVTGTPTCPPCVAGTYGDPSRDNLTFCTPCALGRSQILTGSASCDECGPVSDRCFKRFFWGGEGSRNAYCCNGV